MSEELKNQIRLERIRELLNYRIKRDYSPMTIEKVKDIMKEDIIELRKRDCIQFLNNLKAYIEDINTIIERFTEMDIDEVLLLTYRYNLLYQIVLHEHSNDILNKSLTIDELEKTLVDLEERNRQNYGKI